MFRKQVYTTSIFTNTSILILFFFTFFQMKSCGNHWNNISGYQLMLISLKGSFSGHGAGALLSTSIISYFSAIMGLLICFGTSSHLRKRSVINSTVGAASTLILILTCIAMGPATIKLKWPVFLVLILHTLNIVYYGAYWRTKEIDDPPDNSV